MKLFVWTTEDTTVTIMATNLEEAIETAKSTLPDYMYDKFGWDYDAHEGPVAIAHSNTD